MRDFERDWCADYFTGDALVSGKDLQVFVNDALREQKPLSLLSTHSGITMVAVTPKLAAKLRLVELFGDSEKTPDAAAFHALLGQHHMDLYSPDRIYYVQDVAKLSRSKLVDEAHAGFEMRALTAADQAEFDALKVQVAPEEWDNAYVELDHWAVYGLFKANKLVSACSLYPWGETKIADLGVVTSAEFRCQGLAKALVAYAAEQMAEKGYWLQYRCQLDNLASTKTAESLGMALLGEWQPYIAEG